MERLIAEIHKRTALWDRTQCKYKDRTETKKEWNEVSEIVGISKEECRRRWRNLRDQFAKELKKIPNFNLETTSTQELLALYTGKWMHFRKLLFLKNTITQKEMNRRNMSIVSENSINTTETHSNDASEEQTRPLSNYMSAASRKRKPQYEYEKKGDKIRRLNVGIETTKPVSHQPATDEESTLFLRSLAPFLRILDPIRQLRVRTKFQEILQQELEAIESQGCRVVNGAASPEQSDITAPNSPKNVFEQVIPNEFEVKQETLTEYSFENGDETEF